MCCSRSGSKFAGGSGPATIAWFVIGPRSCWPERSVAPSGCPGCGLVDAGWQLPPLPAASHASAGCWQRYGELLARSSSGREHRAVHQLVVDAYVGQHPAATPRQVRQVALCPMTLSCSPRTVTTSRLDRLLHQRMIAALPRVHFLHPPDTTRLSTVADVLAVDRAAAHRRRVWEGACEVWDAWQPHHATVRGSEHRVVALSGPRSTVRPRRSVQGIDPSLPGATTLPASVCIDRTADESVLTLTPRQAGGCPPCRRRDTHVSAETTTDDSTSTEASSHAGEIEMPKHRIDREIYAMPAFVTFEVGDLEDARAWYEALGFVLLAKLGHGPGRLLHMRRYRYQDILLVPARPGDSAAARTPGARTSFAHTGPLADLDEIADALRGLVAGSVSGPELTPWHAVELEATDPDGHRVVLTARAETPVPQELTDQLSSALVEPA